MSDIAWPVEVAEEATATSVPEEARAFRRLRKRLVVNSVRQLLEQSRLRVSLVVLLSVIFWGGLFVLFIEGFQFLTLSIPHVATRDETVRAIFGVFFASLTVMLVFSAGIILYGSLYRSREVQFLLTTPARIERIFLHKFQETVLVSSWGFLLLGSPMLTAYGLVANAPWYYFALLLPFMFAFVVIPCGVGAIACLLTVSRIPAVRAHALVISCVAAGLVTAIVVWTAVTGAEADLLTPAWFEQMVARLRFSEHRLLPNWWLSTGLLEAARDEWSEAVLFLALTISNALLVHQVSIAVAARTLRSGFSELHGIVPPRRRHRSLWIDRLLRALIRPYSRSMAELIVKDVRLFRRDPVQWSQFLIFVGLLALYFINVRRFRYDVNHATWVNLISFLNITVVGLILSTFTSRFIFPMISLEGRRFWILGLLPVRRETILWSKFLFATTGLLFACTALVVLSDLMLHVLPLIMIVHLVTCVVLCTGLSAIAVGLGAKMPSLREESPSKIAAGFGGTLNLVVSAVYILAVVMLTAVPCHFYVANLQTDAIITWASPERLGQYVWIGTSASVLLGAAATVLPLRMGFRAFRQLEF